MTAALIKNCPKRKVPTCKQDGCKKMTCSNCRIYWCHRCGEQASRARFLSRFSLC